MKYILLILAFVLLPLAVGWAGFEIGKGVGKVVEVEKECPLLSNYCEESESPSLQAMLSQKEFNIKNEFLIKCE